MSLSTLKMEVTVLQKLVEAASNISTVALRAVGGDKKREPSGWGYNLATLFWGDINTGRGPPGWGS
jgi:hypothetical protein